jgi:hypothetical protein
MNIDVLMHAALRRLGPVKLEWKTLHAGGPMGFRVTIADGTSTAWEVEGFGWDELWERFILEAVARR